MQLLDYDIKRDFFNNFDNIVNFDINKINIDIISHITDVFSLNTRYKSKYYKELIEHYRESKDFYDNLAFVYNHDDTDSNDDNKSNSGDIKFSLTDYFKILYDNNDSINIYFETYKLLLEISKKLFPNLFITDRYRYRKLENNTIKYDIDKEYILFFIITIVTLYSVKIRLDYLDPSVYFNTQVIL